MTLTVNELSLSALRQVTPSENLDGSLTYLIGESPGLNDSYVVLTYQTAVPGGDGMHGYVLTVNGEVVDTWMQTGVYSQIPMSVKEEVVGRYNFIARETIFDEVEIQKGDHEIDIDVNQPELTIDEIIRKQTIGPKFFKLSYHVRGDIAYYDVVITGERSMRFDSQLEAEEYYDNKLTSFKVNNPQYWFNQEATQKEEIVEDEKETIVHDPNGSDEMTRTETITETVTKTLKATTKALLKNDTSPIWRREGPNGSYSWKNNGRVLYLHDNDGPWSDDSGSVFFQVPEGMIVKLRMYIDSTISYEEIEGSTGLEAKLPTKDNLGFAPDFGLNKGLFIKNMTSGDRLSIDIDSEDSKVHRFRWVIDGEVTELESDIDDEVYINISDPELTYEATFEVTYDENGNEISRREIGGMGFDEENRKKKEDQDKKREKALNPGLHWGWWVAIGVGVVAVVGLVVFSARRRSGGGGE